jgi:hypothetical protein
MNLQEHIKRILKEEFEEKQVLYIPSLEFFNNDWNLLQRFLEKQGNPLYSIGGNLNLYKTPIKSLGNLKSVGKDLYLFGTPIKSLGNLKSVGKDLDLRNTTIKSLGNLKSVGKDLNLNDTPIESLGNLKSVGGDLNLYGTPIGKKYTKEQIRQIIEVGGDIHL